MTKTNGAGHQTAKGIDELLRTQREAVQLVIRRFKRLTSAKRREYGSAALFLIASLELAIAGEKNVQRERAKIKRAKAKKRVRKK